MKFVLLTTFFLLFSLSNVAESFSKRPETPDSSDNSNQKCPEPKTCPECKELISSELQAKACNDLPLVAVIKLNKGKGNHHHCHRFDVVKLLKDELLKNISKYSFASRCDCKSMESSEILILGHKDAIVDGVLEIGNSAVVLDANQFENLNCLERRSAEKMQSDEEKAVETSETIEVERNARGGPSYNQSYSPPAYEHSKPYQPIHETPKYESPKYEPPKYEAPKYETPSYQTPGRQSYSYEPPKYETSSYQPPSYQPPAYQPPSYEAPKYETPAYQPPSYEPPKYETPSYQPPSYEPPKYQPPTYQPPAYQPPSYHSASYEPPKYEPPKYETPSYQPPAYQPPSYDPPKYETPSYHPPAYQPPSYHPPAYQPPSYDPPKYETPSYQPPSYQPPAYQPPSYDPPKYETPSYEPPSYQPPSYQPPSYQPPAYQPPSYEPPKYDPPKYETPSYQPPAYQPPSYHPPAYQPPSYDPPKYETPSYQPPSYETPKYETPKYETPKYEAPKYETPKYETPKYEAPKYEAPKYETPKYETPKYEAPKYETPKYETPKYEAPKYETPKYETPKYETPKYDPPSYQPPAYHPPAYEAPQYQAPAPAYGYVPQPPPTYNPPTYGYEAPTPSHTVHMPPPKYPSTQNYGEPRSNQKYQGESKSYETNRYQSAPAYKSQSSYSKREGQSLSPKYGRRYQYAAQYYPHTQTEFTYIQGYFKPIGYLTVGNLNARYLYGSQSDPVAYLTSYRKYSHGHRYQPPLIYSPQTYIPYPKTTKVYPKQRNYKEYSASSSSIETQYTSSTSENEVSTLPNGCVSASNTCANSVEYINLDLITNMCSFETIFSAAVEKRAAKSDFTYCGTLNVHSVFKNSTEIPKQITFSENEKCGILHEADAGAKFILLLPKMDDLKILKLNENAYVVGHSHMNEYDTIRTLKRCKD
ncbi:Repetitive proline-rich cell wall protein 2-like protein [Dinothrombium tinctorium]|uniref:Repetitive proline-rich cell wall protein 2-like protein n=1 Tax=Dinothrombium tinctorium TaxID=1965070 RepID=A0A443QTI6_9ACAR|nr:Repetitive proline-rich cell wall protein 2-like protein [Dinothrombium tinctorium]